MSTGARTLTAPPAPTTAAEQRLVVHGVPWQSYVLLREALLEPEECYVLGSSLVEFPDIAVEVVLTAGGIERLPVYATLGVREVWFFEDGAFHLHRLGDDGYEPIDSSELVPGLDFEELAELARHPDQHEAVKAFRDRLEA